MQQQEQQQQQQQQQPQPPISPFSFQQPQEMQQQTGSSNRPPHRMSVKAPKSSMDWRKRLKESCAQKIKDKRQELTNKRRLIYQLSSSSSMGYEPSSSDLAEIIAESELIEKVLKEEWLEMKQYWAQEYAELEELSPEEALQIEQELKEELEDPTIDDYLRYEEQDLLALIETHQSASSPTACFICATSDLIILPDYSRIICPSCGFFVPLDPNNPHAMTPESLTTSAAQFQSNHRTQCQGNVAFSFNPDVGLMAVCSGCDLMEVLL